MLSDRNISFGTTSRHSSDPYKKRDTADRISSTDQSGSQLTQSSEAEGVLVSSLLTRNSTYPQAAAGGNVTVTERRKVGLPAETASNDSLLGSRHHQQSSKLAMEQTAVLGALQQHGTLNYDTLTVDPKPAAALRPSVAKPQAADRDDLIIAMPSSIARMPIVEASRGWRQGVRTYVAFEEEIDLATAPSVFRVPSE